MSEQLESLAAGRLFIQLDLASGYLQIPLTPQAAEKTAFITADTTGQFARMPFGLSGAVAEFTRLMQHVLGPLRGKVVRNYLDDMVIDGQDWPDLLGKFRTVLELLKDARLTLKPSKCSFGTESIDFLGFVVGGGEIRPGPKKTRAISEYPVPSDAHSVRRFLGLGSFFRRFIPKFAEIAMPLTQLTRKEVEFRWGAEQERAFRQLQESLIGDAVLTLFRPDAVVTELHTDTSTVGLDAVLLQSGNQGDLLRVVYYASRKTSDSEARYHSSKLELLCLVWSVQKLRQFLLGVKFVIYTDCQALMYLNNFKSTSSQVARWHDSLQEYDFEVKYRPGVRMGHVDALSRAPVTSDENELDDELAEKYKVCVVLTEEERVLMCQTADPEICALLEAVKADAGRYEDKYQIKQGLLYRKHGDKLLFVMPKTMRKSLLVAAHDLSGHPAVDRTVFNLLQDFWFSRMKRYVRQHINMCFECLLAKNPRGKRPGLLDSIPLGLRPIQTVHMDHVGPFITTESYNRYILVLVDNFTKFVVLYAVENTGAEALLDRMKLFVNSYGLPRKLLLTEGPVSPQSCSTNTAENVEYN